jgi:vitamin B12 transporter
MSVLRLSTSVLLLLVASAAAAQSTKPDTLAAVVITATRLPVATAAPTAATTVLAGDDLRAKGITRVADALRLVPGFAVVSSGGLGSQTSLFVRGGNSNYVRVLVDGTPINDAGGAVDIGQLSTDNLARIEIVRGPASVLYGSDAVTGVIQLFTRDGSGPASVHGLLGGGTRNAQRAELGVRGGSARAGYSLSAAHAGANGFLAFNNANRNDVLSAAARWTPDARTDARLAIRWSASSYQYPTDYTGAVVDRNAEQADHRLTVGFDGGRRLSDRVEVRLALNSNEFLPRSNDGPDSKADTTGFYGSFSRAVRTRRSADLRFNVRLADRTTLTVGGDVARDRERSSSRSLSEFGASASGFEAARHNSAAYAQLLGDVATRFSYTLGARMDQNSAFGAFQTVRAGVAYALDGGVRVRASLGSAFKAPSFFENFATGFVQGNPALEPERSRSAEVGADWTSGDGALALGVTLYTQSFQNVIQYTGTVPSPGAPNYFNVAAADANGAEADLTWHATARTTVTARYSYLDSKTTQAGFDKGTGANYVVGERLIRRPPHTAVVSLAHQFARGAALQVIATRVGERDDRDYVPYPAEAITLPAYTKLDLSASVPLGGRWSVVVRGDNLLDARYQEIARYQAPGAMLFAGLRFGR